MEGRQFQGTCIASVACRLHRSICFPRTHEFLSNLMRVTPIIVVPTSRETRETKLPWYPEFMNGLTTYLVSH